MSRIVVGFMGRMGSGKTTAARYLESRYGFKRMSFSTPVKKIAMEYFGWDGAKDERGRRLLQVLGTEAGRAYDPDIWIKYASEELDRTPNTVSVAFDDVRFENEARWIRALGGYIIRIYRPSAPVSDHPSEALEIPDDLVFSEIVNDGGFRDFYAALDDVLYQIRSVSGLSVVFD